MLSVDFPHPRHKFGIADILKGVHFHPWQRICHQLRQGITAVLRLLPGGTGVQKHRGPRFTCGSCPVQCWETWPDPEKKVMNMVVEPRAN